jgi:hypothetical protein
VIVEQPQDPAGAGAQGQPTGGGGVLVGLLATAGRRQGARELGVQRGALADGAGTGGERPVQVRDRGGVAEEGERAAVAVVRVG